MTYTSEPAPYTSDTSEDSPTQSPEEDSAQKSEDFIEEYHHYPYHGRHHYGHRGYHSYDQPFNMQLLLIIFSMIILFTAIMMVGLSK